MDWPIALSSIQATKDAEVLPSNRLVSIFPLVLSFTNDWSSPNRLEQAIGVGRIGKLLAISIFEKLPFRRMVELM